MLETKTQITMNTYFNTDSILYNVINYGESNNSDERILDEFQRLLTNSQLSVELAKVLVEADITKEVLTHTSEYLQNVDVTFLSQSTDAYLLEVIAEFKNVFEQALLNADFN